ncbi:DUF4062 domain-containing protein [Thiotrichales bacterium HSG1]|nr:DUF4062 domain-containing protein [Thiotrichales bacterium HSG1]
MAENRKLQVFVSSTYKDLKNERQAAVEAILSAGHIPAGMELFAAGDKLQMKVIEDWIDDSDVYLLILGARYGSIEPESGKSYTHLEYEYASKRKKALFACVIDEQERIYRVENGLVKEDYPDKLREFVQQVCCDKVVKFWKNSDRIQYAISHSLNHYFAKRDDLIGWLRSDSVSENDNKLALEKEKKLVQQLKAKLTKTENILLQRKNDIKQLKTKLSVLETVSVEKISNPEKIGENFVETSNDINLEMVYIPAGEFMMGSDEYEDEQPIHKVIIKQPFYMGKYPITQSQWQTVMGNNPSNFKDDKRPVEQVSWNRCG